jgi:hypothetical protein
MQPSSRLRQLRCLAELHGLDPICSGPRGLRVRNATVTTQRDRLATRTTPSSRCAAPAVRLESGVRQPVAWNSA